MPAWILSAVMPGGSSLPASASLAETAYLYKSHSPSPSRCTLWRYPDRDPQPLARLG